MILFSFSTDSIIHMMITIVDVHFYPCATWIMPVPYNLSLSEIWNCSHINKFKKGRRANVEFGSIFFYIFSFQPLNF